MTKAPLGGTGTGANPTDRGKACAWIAFRAAEFFGYALSILSFYCLLKEEKCMFWTLPLSEVHGRQTLQKNEARLII